MSGITVIAKYTNLSYFFCLKFAIGQLHSGYRECVAKAPLQKLSGVICTSTWAQCFLIHKDKNKKTTTAL